MLTPSFPVRLDAPEPLTPFLYGAWTEKFEAAVDAGFDCALDGAAESGGEEVLG